jgi:adenosylhomocysteine nucleosidase
MVFVAAEAREFAGLLPFCGSVQKLDWPIAWARSAELKGRKIFLAANGAGPRCAAEAIEVARTEARDELMESLVSTGFCGGLDPALKVGDVFVATRIQSGAEVSAAQAPQSARRCVTGTLVSVDRVAQTTEEKRDLHSSGAAVVEMEAAGMLSRVREWGMPFYCIRSVTDMAAESFQIDLNAARLADGRFSTPRILAAAIRRPMTVVPELIELRRRCVTAARSLGEFIADCSF